MDANILELRELFNQQVSYRIPQFQRPYAWGEQVQWVPLWDDIRNLVSRVLSRQGDYKILPHFMGAIVLQQRSSNTGEVEKRLVVDGQQRLTTLQLLIKAAEQVFQSRNDSVRASRLRELTINQDIHLGDGGFDNQTKIKQSNINDQKAFQEAMRSLHVGGDNQSWAFRALNYFKEELNNWLDDATENMVDRSNAFEEALTKHLQIAVIDLDQGEKPHIIFETLNARGEPLKQSDLIKNIVMYEANVTDDADQANKLWGLFDDEWWRQETKEGRSTATHIDRFLRYWMVMRALKDVTANRVASEFRNHLESTQSSIQVVTSEIRNAGLNYWFLEGGIGIKSSKLKAFGKRMKAIELGVVTPVLLWLLTSKVPEVREQRCIEILESYGVRRKLCGLQTQGLNRVFIGLLQALDREGPDCSDTTVLHFLKTQQADGGVWPNDRMLYKHLTSSPMKGKSAWKKMVLEAIELNLRSDKSEELGPTSNLTVEHIMPENWHGHWPLSLINSSQGEPENARDEALQNIGNLTLTTEKLNKSLSNGPWHEKRQTLANHSSLFLNKTLLTNALEVWDEDAIIDRSKYLAEIILRIWPYADKFTEPAV